ncbi:hypothetical protein N7470_001559 [Penicillium chermesinum]|nr:hypothetical protein N7470_001559 [Penicillium chermesinum]
MGKIAAKCHKLLEAEILRRSSHIISVAGSQAYVFGGELKPREPRDNDVHSIALQSNDTTVKSAPATSTSPSARVGTAAATLNGKIYIFSGRGGVAMAPIEEQGTIWEFDPVRSTWSSLRPSAEQKYPAARSYHCMTSDGADTLFLHAGCPEKGRLGDVWSFNIARREWTELAPAFDPPRGGTSIAFVEGLLYRMNGFDGKSEQGGSLISTLPPRTHGFLIRIRRTAKRVRRRAVAGKMLDDVWIFDIHEKIWQHVSLEGDELPLPRGWFDADTLGEDAIIVHGGLGESNERLGDIWKLDFVQ